MNILLINHYIGSEDLGMEFRPYYLAKEWVKDNNKVTMVGGSYSHLRKSQPITLGNQDIGGINYFWLWTNKYSGNGISRFLSMLVFVCQLLIMSFYFTFVKRPNIVIASSTYPIDIFPAWVIARLSKAKLVFEIHDIWPMSPMELGKMSKWHPFIMVMRLGEWFAYKFSDHIISIIPGAYEHVKKDGVSESKFTAIPNGVLENLTVADELPPTLQKKIDKLKKKGMFIIGYAGSLGSANPMTTIFDAFKKLNHKKVALILVGNGPQRKHLKKEAMLMKNIVFHNKVAKSQVPLFLSKVDAAYIEFADSPLYRFGVSANKIFDYMLAEKPILQVLNSQYDLIKQADCGISVNPNDSTALKEAISQLMALPPEKLTNMGKNGKVYALSKHNYQHLAREFLRAVCKQKQ